MKATHAIIIYKVMYPGNAPGGLCDINNSDAIMASHYRTGFVRNVAYRVRVRSKSLWDQGYMYHAYPMRWTKNGLMPAVVKKLPDPVDTLYRLYDNAARESARKCGDSYHG